jgi:hypothetical protein
MAEAQEVSKSTVNRLWQLHNIKPHLSGTFKLSRDAKFLEKLTDVVGLYLNPPDKALVLCLDEKSQIQALDRTQSGLPLKKGRCGTMTHDYKRNGTTTLFAALNVLNGKVIGECHGRHRHQEWLKFLRRLDGEFPPGAQIASPDGQLRHAQRTARTILVEEASPFRVPFCADQFQLAESGGALVSRIDREGDPPRQLCQRAGFKTSDRRIHARLERQPQAVHLDGECRADHREDRTRADQDGADQARIHAAPSGKEGGNPVMLFERHYTSFLSSDKARVEAMHSKACASTRLDVMGRVSCQLPAWATDGPVSAFRAHCASGARCFYLQFSLRRPRFTLPMSVASAALCTIQIICRSLKPK